MSLIWLIYVITKVANCVQKSRPDSFLNPNTVKLKLRKQAHK